MIKKYIFQSNENQLYIIKLNQCQVLNSICNILMENKNYVSTLINQANLDNCFYSYPDIQPCVMLWKELVKGNQTPNILVPDTLLLNDKQHPLIWVYTNNQGKLVKNIDINLKDFVNKVTNYCSPNQLAVTLKRATYNQHFINGNDVKLLNARYLQNCSLQQIGGQKDAIICLQKYVKSNGKHAYICRSIWKKNSNSQCFIITNKKSFYDQNEVQSKKLLVKASLNTCSIVKSIQGNHLKQTARSLYQIFKFFKSNRGTILSQIVGDFIKDQTGNWWLINIKAFKIQHKLIKQIQTKSKKSQKEQHEIYQKQKYQKTKICRYCQKTYLESQVDHNITIKMLIQTDRYLLHLGKDYKWLRRSDIQNVDPHCLYQQHKICERCYCLYTQIQALMEIQGDYLKQLGFQLQKKPKELLMSLTNQEQLKNQSKTSQLPSSIQLGPNSKIIFNENCPIKNDQMINKMIRYRVIVYFKELDLIKNLKKDINYYLEYSLFGIKTKFKIDINNHKQTEVSIKKIRINYFFAHSHEDVSSYINNAEDFLINIIAENKNQGQKKVIGNLKLPMKDFVSVKVFKKDFYKLCSVENVSYGWGLQGSIGIIPSETFVNTSRMIFFTNDHLIYLPNQNYYYCQQLPQEWMDLLKKQGEKSKINVKTKNQKQEIQSAIHITQPQQKQQNRTQDSQTWKSILAKQIRKYQKRSYKAKMPTQNTIISLQ